MIFQIQRIFASRQWLSGLCRFGFCTAVLCLTLHVQSQEHAASPEYQEPVVAECGLQFYWQAVFSPPEQQKIRDWLCLNYQQVNDLIGPFQAKVEVYLYRRDNAEEPVPWAFTDRGGDQQRRPQQLHFYVDPRYSLAQLLADWTAVHEFSHLALPLLDRSDQWFAEGFASYLQVQIQHRQGFIEDPRSYFRQKLQSQRAILQQDQPMISLLKQLMQQRRFKAAYWGSALWFVEAEAILAARGVDWFALIRQYQQQHRFQDQDLAAVIRSFDLLLNTASSRLRLSEDNNIAPAIIPQKPAALASEPLQQLWQRYQQQSALQIL